MDSYLSLFNPSKRILVCIAFLVQPAPTTPQQHKRIPRNEVLFPPNDEYDPSILDPNTVHGSPFGGFSRAAASRLAALPLKLPDALLQDDTATPPSEYYEIADHLGRRYVCRVFDDTEVEHGSLKDSLFETPTFRFSVEVQNSRDRDLGERVARVVGAHPENLEEWIGIETNLDPILPPEEIHGPKSISDIVSGEFDVLEIERRLEIALEGLCVQRRDQYWTYEWCYGVSVHRFRLTRHIEDVNYPKVRLQDVSKLGSFESQKIHISEKEDSEDDDDDDKEESPLGFVLEKFDHGDRCSPATKKAKTKVHMQCCSPEKTLSHKSSSLLHGLPHELPIASIVGFYEDPEKPCQFHMDVCTPVLCEDTDMYELEERIDALGIEDNSRWPLNAKEVTPKFKTLHKIELLSVSEILDKILGDNCVYSGKDGWWTYEYCHKRHIRQFNGVPKEVIHNPMDDSQYLLGVYNPQEEVSILDDWKRVVNGTDVIEYGGFTRRRGGNGAYYEMEYTDGEMCEPAEDAADEGFPAIARSCSVRLSCDNSFTLTVREDSTCHYLVEVTVPTLCEHTLFKPATARKQVVKCLSTDGQTTS